jgi:hypothetical protein
MARLRSVQREVLHLMCKVMPECMRVYVSVSGLSGVSWRGKTQAENWREKRGSNPICDPFPRVGGWLVREKREGTRRIEERRSGSGEFCRSEERET